MENVGSQAFNITGSFARTMRIAEHFRCELNRRCPIADSRWQLSRKRNKPRIGITVDTGKNFAVFVGDVLRSVKNSARALAHMIEDIWRPPPMRFRWEL